MKHIIILVMAVRFWIMYCRPFLFRFNIIAVVLNPGVNRVEMQTSNQTTGITIQDGKPKKLVQFDKDLAGKMT